MINHNDQKSSDFFKNTLYDLFYMINLISLTYNVFWPRQIATANFPIYNTDDGVNLTLCVGKLHA